MACPAVETLTLAAKVPKGRAIHHIPTPPSRLESQTRTNVVYVQTNRKPYCDEQKRVNLNLFLLLLFSKGESKRETKVHEWMGALSFLSARLYYTVNLLRVRLHDGSGNLHGQIVHQYRLGRYCFCMYVLILLSEYQFEKSSQRLQQVYELAMGESSKPGMDYNKEDFLLILIFCRWVEARQLEFLPYVGDFHRVRL